MTLFAAGRKNLPDVVGHRLAPVFEFGFLEHFNIFFGRGKTRKRHKMELFAASGLAKTLSSLSRTLFTSSVSPTNYLSLLFQWLFSNSLALFFYLYQFTTIISGSSFTNYSISVHFRNLENDRNRSALASKQRIFILLRLLLGFCLYFLRNE